VAAVYGVMTAQTQSEIEMELETEVGYRRSYYAPSTGYGYGYNGYTGTRDGGMMCGADQCNTGQTCWNNQCVMIIMTTDQLRAEMGDELETAVGDWKSCSYCSGHLVCYQSQCVMPIYDVNDRSGGCSRSCGGNYRCHNNRCAMPTFDITKETAVALPETEVGGYRQCHGTCSDVAGEPWKFLCRKYSCVLGTITMEEVVKDVRGVMFSSCVTHSSCPENMVCHKSKCVMPVVDSAIWAEARESIAMSETNDAVGTSHVVQAFALVGFIAMVYGAGSHYFKKE